MQLLGVIVAALAAGVWFDRVTPGHRSTRLGRPTAKWALLPVAVTASALLTLPLLAYASLGIANAVFLLGIGLLSQADRDAH